MNEEKRLCGDPVSVDYMQTWSPNFYVDDHNSCDARLIAKRDGAPTLDLGQVSSVDYRRGYAILADGQRRIEFSEFAQYTFEEKKKEK